tara:strand:+ start:25494 stop:25607 length:114 start_codon:yes stop_codon:yes gene_type:complete
MERENILVAPLSLDEDQTPISITSIGVLIAKIKLVSL